MFIKRNRKCCKKGISIVELLIMILIIGILGSVTYPHILGMYARSHEASVKSNMFTLQVAAENFASMAEGLYPVIPTDEVGHVLSAVAIMRYNPHRIADACPANYSFVSTTQYALLPGDCSFKNPFLLGGNCFDVSFIPPSHQEIHFLTSGQGTVYWVPDTTSTNPATRGYKIYGDGYNNILFFVLSSGY